MSMTVSSPDLAQPGLGIPATLNVELPRAWRDTVQIELGAELAWSPELSLSATAGYHSPVSPDSTVDTASLDGHRLLGALGVAWQVLDGVTLFAAGEVHGILPRTVTTSDYDLGNGTYNLVVAALTAHVQIELE
jgi:long-chain fatty acid transport protein